MADDDWISLEDLLGSSGRPGVDQMLLVASWVTEALADGHLQGAVHGGLSPQTVGLVLGTDGSPTRATIHPPAEDGSLATAYAAPEVLRGATPDAAADVYSCGAVLWHCLSGQTPRPESPPSVTATEPLAGTLRAMLAEKSGERPSATRAWELLKAPEPAGHLPPTSERTEELSAVPEGTEELQLTDGPASGQARGRSRGWGGVLSAAVLLLGLSVLGWVVWQVVQDDPARTSSAAGTVATAPEADEGSGDEGTQGGDGEGTGTSSEAATTTQANTSPTTEDEAATQRPAEDEEGDDDADEPRQIALPAAAELCEDRLDEPYPQVWAGNEVTSCPFSVNVREAYLEKRETGADVEVVADSPVTGRTYTMACEDTAPVRCRGGNAAIVYFGDD